MCIFKTLGESLSRMSYEHILVVRVKLTFLSFSGLNSSNIDHTARSISAVVKATT